MYRSLKDIKPTVTSHDVGMKRVLLSSNESGCSLTQIAVTDLKAGEIANAHVHPDMQEAFYVMEGELDVLLDGVSRHCVKDDFVYVTNLTSHELKAVTDVRVMTIGCVIESTRDKLYPMLFEPNLHPVLWGGDRISRWKDIPVQQAIGESWEVSAVPGNESIVSNGTWAGYKLSQVIEKQTDAILGKSVALKSGGKLPLLVKFIDAKNDLSIQVHPDDSMAKREHGKLGKTEMWYVIDAQPGAHLYAGFKEKISKEQYKKLVENGKICDALACHEVHPGDVFYIPAGRIHAICGGVMLAEVQQSSDVTYRIFDYNRPGLDGKPRELHTELASQALDFKVENEYRTSYTQTNNTANRVIDSEFFSVRVTEFSESFHRNLIKYDSFIISMCIKGSCKLRVRSTGYEILLREGYSCLIPAAIADYDIIPVNKDGIPGNGAKACVLDAFMDNKDRSFARMVTRFLHITNK